MEKYVMMVVASGESFLRTTTCQVQPVVHGFDVRQMMIYKCITPMLRLIDVGIDTIETLALLKYLMWRVRLFDRA